MQIADEVPECMPFDLPLPEPLARQGWKAKVRDRERLETPHITVLFKTRSWRVSLRSLETLGLEPPPRDVPHEILEAIERHLSSLCGAWNPMYPDNPV